MSLGERRAMRYVCPGYLNRKCGRSIVTFLLVSEEIGFDANH